MHLDGSCHCGSVRFSVESNEPVPFMRCYCSICRKTAGTGGYAINLGADHRSFKLLKGMRYLKVYQAVIDGKQSTAERHFCGRCGTALWLYDKTWPDLIHPHAGAIDTPLPVPPAHVHMMLGSKPEWVEVDDQAGDEQVPTYPKASLADWHRAHGV
ncbi:GFA family protein [Roseateles amylovorans]|uniref:GFA family protein n=1 Tax=Roseateles amylovorans TaxID=2978473 RepID=A0ABY6B8U0_9BURK|nr:GFA family protein [Roseateles amylovorans]UXH79985.1 GFA family protein [Roseateles amylovorans]